MVCKTTRGWFDSSTLLQVILGLMWVRIEDEQPGPELILARWWLPTTARTGKWSLPKILRRLQDGRYVEELSRGNGFKTHITRDVPHVWMRIPTCDIDPMRIRIREHASSEPRAIRLRE